MAEWKVHSDLWLVRQEQIASNAWLLCFAPNTKGDAHTHWINVMSREWYEGSHRNGEPLEKYELVNVGLLELECICHEMREKYGGGK